MGRFYNILFQSYSPSAEIQLFQFNTIKSAATTITLFHLPLSIEAYEQFQQLDIIIQNIQLTSESDQWR